MAGRQHEDEGNPQYNAMYVGTVTNNEDPKGVGRILFTIPGFIEPDGAWARPMGTMGGGINKRGGFFVPPVNAEVTIFFAQGDIDTPYYLAAHWGAEVEGAADDGGTGAEVPTGVREIPITERKDVKCIETERWLIRIDDRLGDPNDPEGENDPAGGRERLQLLYKDDPEGTFVEIDGLNRFVVLSATAGIQLVSLGTVTLDANQVQIQGRTVNPFTSKEI